MRRKRPTLILRNLDNASGVDISDIHLVENSKSDINTDYEFIRELDDIYSQNTIELAINRHTCIEVIVKKMSKLGSKERDIINKECNALKIFNNQSILSVIDIYEDNKYVYIVSEWFKKGDLATHLIENINILKKSLKSISVVSYSMN